MNRTAIAGTLLLLWGAGAGPPADPPAESAAAKRDRAGELLREGKPEEAARLYAEILDAGPADGIALSGRVRALLALGRWREALEEALRRAAGAASPDAQVALGEALMRAGRLGEATSALETAARGPHPPPRALLLLARLRAAEGRDREAAGLFDRALEAAPDDRDVLFWSAGAAPTRAAAIERLEKYLERSAGDDPDRIQGARDNIRIFRALGERPVWVPVERPERAEIPLRPIADGEGGAAGYCLEATLGGERKVRLLLDTGSTGLFLVERMARHGGFEPLGEMTVFAGGGEGREYEKRGLLPSFAIGPLKFADALATATSKEIEPTGRYHGVLGLAPLRGYRIGFDLARSRLLLEPPSEPAQGRPYWVVEGQILVEAATSDGQRGLFLLDTGAVRSIVSDDLVKASPRRLATKPVTMRIYGSPVRAARAVLGLEIEFAGVGSRGKPLLAADLSRRGRLGGVEVAGFIGLDLLQGNRLVVDTAGHRIALWSSR